MKKKVIPLLLLFIASHVAYAVSVDDADPAAVDRQNPQSSTYVSLVQNYPILMFECLGMDYLYNLDATVDVPFHKMKKFKWSNLFRGGCGILYAVRLNQSRFAFCAGIGYSVLYYAFASIEGKEDGQSYPILKRKDEFSTECISLESEKGRVLLGSLLKIPFIDLLFRLRFNSVLDEPKAGFHTWLGFKFGFRQRASMMICYRAYNDSGASSVDNGDFNLKGYAWAVQAGIGYSRFGLTGGFHLTPLFQKNHGPSNSDVLRPFSFGIYVDLL